jgi:predicted nucleic acid-binding Zn ribbon protein
MDWWTGSAASHTKQCCSNKGDMDEYEKHRIKAPKLLLPYLFISLYLWLVLSP